MRMRTSTVELPAVTRSPWCSKEALSGSRKIEFCGYLTSISHMKTRRAGSVLSLSKSRCKRKIQTSTFKWGRRILFAALLLLIFQFGKFVYYSTWKSEAEPDYSLEDDIPHHGRKLLSEGAVWEKCDFEKAHTPHAFLPAYIFFVFLLFVGKNNVATYD